jgi:hypothetical protein
LAVFTADYATTSTELKPPILYLLWQGWRVEHPFSIHNNLGRYFQGSGIRVLENAAIEVSGFEGFNR